MTEIITFLAEDVAPERDAVLRDQGLPADAVVPGEVEAICVTALRLLAESVAPAGILAEMSRADFAAVYHGEGRNEPSTPVGDVLDRADHLAVFAATLGEPISREIEERFRTNDFALGCMLDSAASTATEKMTAVLESRFHQVLSRKGQTSPATGVLAYSPGYCGWHISGQKALFEVLRPERIGISLNESFLMQPLKSVSGVMMAGPREMHDVPDSYPFCSRCEARGCRGRIRALLGE